MRRSSLCLLVVAVFVCGACAAPALRFFEEPGRAVDAVAYDTLLVWRYHPSDSVATDAVDLVHDLLDQARLHDRAPVHAALAATIGTLPDSVRERTSKPGARERDIVTRLGRHGWTRRVAMLRADTVFVSEVEPDTVTVDVAATDSTEARAEQWLALVIEAKTIVVDTIGMRRNR